MRITVEALCWATLILIMAYVMKSNAVQHDVAFGVITGLTGAAFGALYGKGGAAHKDCRS